MSAPSVDDVVDRLAELVQSDHLPSRARPAAERLMERLSSPVRIAVLGASGAGKSLLCALLETAHQLAADAPKVTLIDAKIDADGQDLASVAGRAAEGADMTIWVTADFDTEDQRVWKAMPDTVRNHAFLVINLHDGANRPDAARLRSLRRHGFSAVFALDVLHEHAALRDGTALVQDLQGDSQVDPLISALNAQVVAGCRADIDGALMFLQRFAGARAPRRQTRALTRPLSRRTTRAVTRPVDQIDAAPMAGPQSQPDLSKTVADSGATAALELIRDRSQGLEGRSTDSIMAELSDLLNDLTDRVNDPSHLVGSVTQAQDLVVLLQLEGTEQAAADAALAALQIKRQLEAEAHA